MNQDTHFAGLAHPSCQDNRNFRPVEASLEQTMPTLPALISQGRFRRRLTEGSGLPIESVCSSSVCSAFSVMTVFFIDRAGKGDRVRPSTVVSMSADRGCTGRRVQFLPSGAAGHSFPAERGCAGRGPRRDRPWSPAVRCAWRPAVASRRVRAVRPERKVKGVSFALFFCRN